jgi:hypothetical protein
MHKMTQLTANLRLGGLLMLLGMAAQATVPPGEDLQAILNRGDDLGLQQGAVYPISQPLKYKRPGQKIFTAGATNLSDYATLLLVNSNELQIINASGVPGATLERVIVDGNRYRLSSARKLPKVPQNPMMAFGGKGAEGQIVRNNLFRSTRSWSTMQIREGGNHILVENNIVLGAGVDPRGNGRESHEVPFAWSDGFSCAAQNTILRNNLIIDPTDVGIVLYGAPGSRADGNVIASVSRESLGGINMVDPLSPYLMEGSTNRFDYRGDVVRDNFIDALGARIHIGLPMGGPIWGPKSLGTILVGAEICENTMAGGAAAYGFVLNGVDQFNVHDNRSIASYSGIGEGVKANKPPDEPGPFLFDPQHIGDSKLQADFKPCVRHLVHLLRANHGSTNSLGYRIYAYGEAEAKAAVTTAYLEMLQRAPTAAELAAQVQWLQDDKRTADELRRKLMASDEFVRRFGTVPPDDLQLYRQKLWFDLLSAEQRKANGATPTALTLFQGVLKKLNH